MGKVIASYCYTYGSGQEPNRRIDFIREEEGNKESLVACFQGKLNGSWQSSTRLTATFIEVEMDNTTQKIKNLIDARKEGSIPTVNKQPINQIDPEVQDTILQSLVPRGTKKLEIENDVGEVNGLEQVKAITIFDTA